MTYQDIEKMLFDTQLSTIEKIAERFERDTGYTEEHRQRISEDIRRMELLVQSDAL